MSDGEFWSGAILAGLLAWGATAYHYKDAPKPPEIGRYQIVKQSDARMFLLDTASGDAWSWIHVRSEYQKPGQFYPDDLIEMWQKTTKFVNEMDEINYISSVHESDRKNHQQNGTK